MIRCLIIGVTEGRHEYGWKLEARVSGGDPGALSSVDARGEKGIILQEFGAVCDYHRKHAIPEPAVSRRTLIFSAGCFWAIGGLFLLLISASLLTKLRKKLLFSQIPRFCDRPMTIKVGLTLFCPSSDERNVEICETMSTEYVVLGTSIWQQNMPLLERLTINREERAEILPKLKDQLGVDELIFLSTCNRVEFIYATSGAAGGSRILHRLIDFFCRDGQRLSFFPNDFYHYTGREAITHVYRMVSSLESLVMGETQITGQFKQAHQDSAEIGISGPALDGLACEALLVAKRVKRETSIGVGAVSMASLAAAELKPLLADDARPLIALVGSGEMTAKMARYILEMGGAELLFVNRTLDKAEQLAAKFGGCAVSLDDFRRAPQPVAAIVSATAAIEPVFTSDFLTRLDLATRPVICIDLAIPRDFADVFSHTEGVKLVNIHDLKSQAQGNLRQKFIEASKADGIVKQAVSRFMSDRIEVSLKPIFHDSYRESLELAREAIDDLFAKRKSTLPAEEKERVMRLVTRLVGHSAFQPARMLADRLAQSQTELNLSGAVTLRKAAN